MRKNRMCLPSERPGKVFDGGEGGHYVSLSGNRVRSGTGEGCKRESGREKQRLCLSQRRLDETRLGSAAVRRRLSLILSVSS